MKRKIFLRDPIKMQNANFNLKRFFAFSEVVLSYLKQFKVIFKLKFYFKVSTNAEFYENRLNLNIWIEFRKYR